MSLSAELSLEDIDISQDFRQAYDLMENTRQHLFVTGKAGTGKSTLLKYFRLKTQKNVVVLSPTGVSALVVGGQTIHSFFQFKPDITLESVSDIILRKAKRQLLKSLDSIIIDEVSMVRADIMDCIDTFLRMFGPHPDEPFGGIQMIFFGDLFQLPPVVRREEERIFNQHYESPFFFSAFVMKHSPLRCVHLTKIYRQSDEQFISLLNAIRTNHVRVEDLTWLNQRRVDPPLGDGALTISLTSTNAIADRINQERLLSLPGEMVTLQGQVGGDFDKRNLPTTEFIPLKIGAQIMLLTNDTDKRWVNGTLGQVSHIHQDDEGDITLIIDLENGEKVDVRRHTWDMYQFYMEEATGRVQSKVVGTFTQWPVKLAWAVTIHKAQGQTFDRVFIDIGQGTFAHGQMYVALSRCRHFHGVFLKQRIENRHILMDNRVLNFMQNHV